MSLANGAMGNGIRMAIGACALGWHDEWRLSRCPQEHARIAHSGNRVRIFFGRD